MKNEKTKKLRFELNPDLVAELPANTRKKRALSARVNFRDMSP